MGHKGLKKKSSLYLIQQLEGAITNYLNLLSSGKLGGVANKTAAGGTQSPLQQEGTRVGGSVLPRW